MLRDKNQLTVVRTHCLWRVHFSNSISRPKSITFAVSDEEHLLKLYVVRSSIHESGGTNAFHARGRLYVELAT